MNFADTGLGKTRMQLAWAHHVWEATGRPILILAPLAVAEQTVKEGREIGGVVLDESSIIKHHDSKTLQRILSKK